MKYILKIEELVLFLACAYGLYVFDFPWWTYLLLFIGPDISMLGYLAGPSVGAFFYNLFHHKAVALALIAVGWQLNSENLVLAGIIIFGHSSMDRMFGYGLKYNDSFKHTHLGVIGKNNN